MHEQIKVHVVKYPDRANLVMRYVDPDSGKHVARSAKTSNQRQAEREAAKWEADLREGRYEKRQRITWQEFREQFERDYLDGLKVGTAGCYEATLNVFESMMRPGKLAELTTPKLTAFATMLRDQGRKPATVARHLRTLKVACRWAHRQGLLLKLPQFTMPKYAKGMRGRPITLEEFERMLTATPKVMGRKAAPSWKFLLRGLWTSGLRLGESLALSWVEAPGAIVADLGGRRPMLRIPAESEKGNTHRLLPMAPEFAELLQTVPVDARTGWVFRPLAKTGEPAARTRWAIGSRVAAIGAKAGVVVGQHEKPGEDGKPQTANEFASAHDLRRSFGFRWSRRVMPMILRELMRHETVETTLRYYVGTNAEATADELWRVVGDAKASEELSAANR